MDPVASSFADPDPRMRLRTECVSSTQSARYEAKMNARPDNTRAILKALPERPEAIPRGYEFLPDAFKRDVEPHGPEARDQVVRALAEGDIPSKLHAHLGQLHPIPLRMWRKYPLARKVHPRLHDGKMRMGLCDFSGPYLVGWICVREGDLRRVVQGLLSDKDRGTQRSSFSFVQLEKAYKEHVRTRVAAGRRSSREEDREAMSEALGVTIPHRHIRTLREKHAPGAWKSHGRPSNKTGHK